MGLLGENPAHPPAPIDHGARASPRLTGMLRILLIPLLMLTSCGMLGLTTEEQQALTSYQRNAKIYWGGGDIDRALDQVRRGLELAPHNYQLHVIKANCLLRKSKGDSRMLDAAIAAFDHVMTLRGVNSQGPQARLGYATAYTRRGVASLRERQQINSDAARLGLEGPELDVQTAHGDKLALDAAADLKLAKVELERMIDSGDYVLEAYFRLMQVSTWQGHHDEAIEMGGAYLERVTKLQDSIRENLQSTVYVEYERDLRIRLQNRLDEEIAVRAFLANLHYKSGRHALAVEQLNAVLTRNPRLHFEYYNRARSLLELGRTAEAKSDFERFLYSNNLPREHPQVKAALNALKEIE